MNSEEQSTLQNDQATLNAILKAVEELGQRMTNLETEVRQRFEKIEERVFALEVKFDDFSSLVSESVSVSYKSLSVAQRMNGEVRALREESAYHGREIKRLEAAINRAS